MKLIETQIAFGGFYESQHDANIDAVTENYFSDETNYEDNDFIDYFDWSAIHESYLKFWVDKFEDYLKNNYNIKTPTAIFEDVKLWSPKFYNYTTDHIDCKIYDRYANKLHMTLRHDNDFKAYVRSGTTSCDGYISHYTYNEVFNNKDNFLTVYCLDFLAKKFNEDKFYELAEDVYNIDIELTEAGKEKADAENFTEDTDINTNQLKFAF